jgi:hypothetical protein
LLGTNKSASVWGTAIAAVQYSRRVQIDWPVLLPAAATALVGAWLGAWAVTQVDGSFLRKLLPFILLGVLAYTLARKNLGEVHAPRHSPRAALAIACSIGGLIGWYDGFFGPGTGSFFIFLLVRFLGYDFLNASAAAKLLERGHQSGRLGLVCGQGPCLVAHRPGHGGGQCGGQPARLTPGPEAWRDLRAPRVRARRQPADPEDRARCVLALM